jgi:two-component system chemotaxis response regulator CheY
MAKILSVDDSKLIRDMVSTVLRSEGHEVMTAEDGLQGMELARQHTFDLVLADINMPVMNGIDMVAKMRELEGYEFTPIVMMTTETSNYKKEKAKSIGASGWLAKPFTPERLLKAVNKLTG